MQNLKLVNIRAIAILLVVLGHSIIIYSPDWKICDTEITSAFLANLKSVIYIFHMPLFFWIAGFCFKYSVSRHEISYIIKKKARRLLVPYFAIAFLYMNPIKIFLGIKGYTLSSTLILQQLFTINCGHLWYIVCLFAIFLVGCFIKFVAQKVFFQNSKDGEIECKLIFWGGISLLSACCANIFKSYLGDFLQVGNIVYYQFFFLMGFMTAYFKHVNMTIRTSFIILLVFLFSILIAYICHGRRFILNLTIASLIIMALYKYIPSKYNKMLHFIDNNSYGIYLFHSPLIYFMFQLAPNVSPFIMVFVNFVVMGMIALVLTYGVRIANVKWLIGE